MLRSVSRFRDYRMWFYIIEKYCYVRLIEICYRGNIYFCGALFIALWQFHIGKFETLDTV